MAESRPRLSVRGEVVFLSSDPAVRWVPLLWRAFCFILNLLVSLFVSSFIIPLRKHLEWSLTASGHHGLTKRTPKTSPHSRAPPQNQKHWTLRQVWVAPGLQQGLEHRVSGESWPWPTPTGSRVAP